MMSRIPLAPVSTSLGLRTAMPKRRARSRQGMQLDEGAEPRDHLPDDECIHLVRAAGVRAMIDVSLQGC